MQQNQPKPISQTPRDLLDDIQKNYVHLMTLLDRAEIMGIYPVANDLSGGFISLAGALQVAALRVDLDEKIELTT